MGRKDSARRRESPERDEKAQRATRQREREICQTPQHRTDLYVIARDKTISTHTHTHTHSCIYIYIYRERKGGRRGGKGGPRL